MGLFDKFKKKSVEESEQTVPVEDMRAEETEAVEGVTEEAKEEVATEEVTETTEMKAEREEAEETANASDEEDRRFTLLVEKAYQLEDENGVVVVGNLHGKIKKGDKIYVLFPNNRMLISSAEEIEVGPGRRVTEAEDDVVAIQIFEIKTKEQMPSFTIITNIVPSPDAKEGKELENPLLLGMSMEYPKYGQDITYNNLLIYILCHTRYVVPAKMNMDNAAPGKRPMIQFPSLADPNKSGSYSLPVFTDWNALSRWDEVFDEKHPTQSVVMPFQDAVSVCKGRGIVINPFGPMVISLSEENINQIVNMENYKREFGSGEETQKPVQQEVKRQNQPQMMLGIPKDDQPEVKAVKEAIIAYAKQDTDIKRIDLLLKVDLQQRKSFVCIVDCPENQTARIGAAIQNVVRPQLKEVDDIDFFLYGSAKFVNDMVTEQSVIYQK